MKNITRLIECRFINTLRATLSLIVLSIFLSSVFFSNSIYAQKKVFIITQIEDNYDLNDYTEITSPKNQNLDILEIKKQESELKFKPLSERKNLSHDSIYWLRIKIDNQLANARLLSNWKLFVGETDLFTVYQVSPSGEVLNTVTGGSLNQKEDKSIKFGNKFNRVALDFNDLYPQTIYIKTQRITHRDFSLEITLSKYDFFESWDFILQTRYELLFLGFLITMMTFNFLFFFETKDKAFLYHGLFILGVFIFNLEYFALTQDISFVKSNPLLKQSIDYLGLAIMDIAYYQFFRYYLNLNTILPKWDKILKTMIYVKILVFTYIILHYTRYANIPFTDTIAAIFLMSQYLIIGVLLIPIFKLKDKKGMFLIAGSIILLTAILFNAGRIIQGLELILLPTLIGITGEIFCFSLGLGYRMKELKDKALEKERKTTIRLKEIDQLKDQFLANTSHELRTPLNGIIGLSESIYEDKEHSLSSDMKRDLSMIINSGKRLSRMINDILDFSKIRQNELKLNIKPTDLHSTVEVCLHLLKPQFQKKKLTIVNEIESDFTAVMADEDRLQQILINLIENAIKFTDHGTITLKANSTNNIASIIIKDSGIGISKDKLDSIFLQFSQADSTIERKYGGSGLGLSITKKLVELQGGNLSVESQIGIGSSFTFTLQATQKKVDATPPSTSITNENNIIDFEPEFSNSNSQSLKAGTHKILVVDDEVINRQVIFNMLKENEFSIFQAKNGKEALLAIDEYNFDLILLDVMMPEMNGYEVCRQIRLKHLPNELPIIMVTAKNQTSDIVEGLNMGANDYLVKPISRNELNARVKTHINLLKISASYSRFVPREFLHTLGKTNIIDVQLGDQTQKNITVMFMDIRSYTALSESMTVEENFRFLNAYFKRVGPSIRKNNGFVNQFLGDGIMALFLNNPENALKASLEILNILELYNEQRKESNRQTINIGMGLHYGPIMLGIIGDDKRMDAGVVSDAVNTASRVEGLTKYYGAKIILSEDTVKQIPNLDAYTHRYLGKVLVKGRKKAVGVYEFFGGDDSVMIDHKTETKVIFEMGLDAYFNKNFTAGASYFKNVLENNSNDLAAKIYLNNCANFMVNGVPIEWDGAHKIAGK